MSMSPSSATTVINDIRRKFPFPSIYTRGEFVITYNQSYCVGGAFCKYFDHFWENLHPTPYILSEKLRLHNFALNARPGDTRIESNKAYLFASRIVDANDRGDFEKAWALLHDALVYDVEPAPMTPGPEPEEEGILLPL